jgi:hypothetical protein
MKFYCHQEVFKYRSKSFKEVIEDDRKDFEKNKKKQIERKILRKNYDESLLARPFQSNIDLPKTFKPRAFLKFIKFIYTNSLAEKGSLFV